MNEIFLSYKRSDDSGYVGRLADSLGRIFGEGTVYRDVDSVRAGRNWKKSLARSVSGAEVVLAVIGPSWQELITASPTEERDWVRYELNQAHDLEIPVIPVRLAQAEFDYKQDLQDLVWLNDLQFFELADGQGRWESDLAKLAEEIARITSLKKREIEQEKAPSMSKEIRQESTGPQSPNVVSEGPVTISYYIRKNPIVSFVFVGIIVVIFALVVKWILEAQEVTDTQTQTELELTGEQLKKLDEQIKKVDRQAKVFAEMIKQSAPGNPEVAKIVEEGDVRAVVQGKIALLQDMQSQIEDYPYFDDDGQEVDVQALLDEVNLDEAEEWIANSYNRIRFDPEKAQRAAAEAFVLGGIESLRFEYVLARDYFREAIEFDPDNSLYRSQLGSLELLHGKQRADFITARKEFEKALQITFCALGEPDSQGGSTLIDTCDLEVTPRLRDACDTEVRSTPDQAPDPEIATILNDLGKAWDKIPHWIRANCYYERALEIRRKTDGDNAVSVAAVLNNIGIVLDKMIKREEAREKFDEAANIYKLDKMTKREGAREKFDEAENIYELNENWDWAYANTLHNMGASWFDSGIFGNAHDYFTRAYKVREEVLGTEHPDTASSLYSLGNVAMELDDPESASKYYGEAHGIFKDTLGHDHPYTCAVEVDMCRAANPESDQCLMEIICDE